MEEMGMYGLEAVRGQFRGQEESRGARVKCRVGSPHMMVMCSLWPRWGLPCVLTLSDYIHFLVLQVTTNWVA